MGDLLARTTDPVGPILFVFVAIVAIALFVWQFGASRRMLERWAADNRLQLLSAERRWLVTGPFWWRTGKNQVVYRIEVRDAQGQQMTGWARCGGWFLGPLSDQVDVEWDRPPPPRREPPGFPVIMPGDDPRPPR